MNNTMKKILFTLKECGHCDTLMEKLQKEISDGKYDIRECDLDSKDDKVLKICKDAIDRVDFDGFPSIYDLKGIKEY